jgi:hypothetical protein
MSPRASPVLVGTVRLGRLRPLSATGQEHPLPRDCFARPVRDDVTAGGSPLRLMTDSDLHAHDDQYSESVHAAGTIQCAITTAETALA